MIANFVFVLAILGLFIISYLDIKYYEVDWRILLFTLFVCIIYGWLTYTPVNLIAAVLIGSFIPVTLTALSHEKWMGWGDVLISVSVSALSGFPGSLIAISSAFIVAALFGIIFIKLNKKLKVLPFGPFLVIGALIAKFFGSLIIHLIYAF